ncbi:ABC transporter ATP-binding protein [Paenibacillus xylaniclasticus]|uniref:ABC transporter ATP-binding protein n=1 Tax=Paenibacillus xylaniclasticus TaxID=588083 RepID=UPI000FD91B37|nr:MULTISPECIES: ABC transporter ATP-binding protein [Paenibacillus]GFN32049.1 ABC transporter ATP-binding protein [Paenibacillus curdlanolyticus]
MIRVTGLTKSYGQGSAQTYALREVSLEIGRGEYVAITGPSGCGKTTLLNVLAGIESLDAGQVWINQTALHEMSENDISRLRLERMGFIFQSYHLVPVLTALDNVALPLIARGIRQSEANRQAREALRRVGLAGYAKRYPSEMSGGQNQRVAIARAIVGNPEILWADEPTGALDSEAAEQIVGLLEMLNKHDGTTVVIVTHDNSIASRASRMIRLHNGRVIHDGGAVVC